MTKSHDALRREDSDGGLADDARIVRRRRTSIPIAHARPSARATHVDIGRTHTHRSLPF